MSNLADISRKKILILGEYGNFGQRICRALVDVPGIECILGAPRAHKGSKLARKLDIGFKLVDVRNRPILRQSLQGIFAVVNTCGPFQTRDYTVAEQCADRGIHYIDPADSRDYVSGFARLSRRAEKSGSMVVSGASALPAVSTCLVDMVAYEFDRIDEIHTSLAHGSKDQRYLATVRGILGFHVGMPRRRARNGQDMKQNWAKPIAINFPAPVGKRRFYLSNVPDIDIFPKRYGVHTVTFRTGLPSTTINLSLSLLSGLRRRGHLISLPPSAEFLLRRVRLFQGFGAVSGGLRVMVQGQKSGQMVSRTVSLVARDENGQAIQTAATIALIKKWVNQGVTTSGAVPCVGLLSLDEIKSELLGYDIVIVRS